MINRIDSFAVQPRVIRFDPFYKLKTFLSQFGVWGAADGGAEITISKFQFKGF